MNILEPGCQRHIMVPLLLRKNHQNNDPELRIASAGPLYKGNSGMQGCIENFVTAHLKAF